MNAELIYETIRREKVIVIIRGFEKDRIINVAEAVPAIPPAYLKCSNFSTKK
jgi:hypothetical protein